LYVIKYIEKLLQINNYKLRELNYTNILKFRKDQLEYIGFTLICVILEKKMFNIKLQGWAWYQTVSTIDTLDQKQKMLNTFQN